MRRVLKWLGIVFILLIGIIVVAALAGTIISNRRIATTYALADEALPLPTDAASLAEGCLLYTSRCV